MSVKKKEVTLLMKTCVIVSACALTASMTWLLAKRTYDKKGAPEPPPVNKWKIALLTLGALWVMKKIMMESSLTGKLLANMKFKFNLLLLKS